MTVHCTSDKTPSHSAPMQRRGAGSDEMSGGDAPFRHVQNTAHVP